MQPLLISATALVSSLGAGTACTLDALREQRSGLAPCRFETVTLDTWIGAVPGVDDVVMASGLADFDCRNNRLAQLGLYSDGFAAAIDQVKERYGPAPRLLTRAVAEIRRGCIREV